ncbi:hypothetical protein BJ912DRAFT_362933 [Pholiota molesta]|nr:hypothetical protein BJ912DRAFT_362933 [Pholiota molesta]
MHFSKLITAFIVVAATGALAYREEAHGHELAGAHQEFEGREGGSTEAGAGFDNSEMEFTPVGETSLEAASNGYCFFGRCLRRNSYHRRCPRGFRVVGFRRCGWWRIRALCCRYRRRWAHGEHVEGEEAGAELSERSELDELDN